jgi:hypothetical protein
MPNENPTRDRSFGDMERAVVYLLTDPCRQPTLWTLPDIGRELEYFDPEMLVEPLQRAGLLYRTSDGHVFAAPAAFHLTALVGHII